MQFDELIKLVREVGNAGLSDFEYREGELFIKMSACQDVQPDSGGMSVYESRHRARKRKERNAFAVQYQSVNQEQDSAGSDKAGEAGIGREYKEIHQQNYKEKPRQDHKEKLQQEDKGELQQDYKRESRQDHKEEIQQDDIRESRQDEKGGIRQEHKKELRQDRNEDNREVFEAPVEGIFWFSRLDGTPCPLKLGDEIRTGQVLGKLDCRGRCFEIASTLEGKVVNIYIEDGEEIVAREAMFMVETP